MPCEASAQRGGSRRGLGKITSLGRLSTHRLVEENSISWRRWGHADKAFRSPLPFQHCGPTVEPPENESSRGCGRRSMR